VKGPYLQFFTESFNSRELLLITYKLEPFNDCDLIIGGYYKGKQIDFESGNTTGVHEEIRIIHDEDDWGEQEWDY